MSFDREELKIFVVGNFGFGIWSIDVKIFEPNLCVLTDSPFCFVFVLL